MTNEEFKQLIKKHQVKQSFVRLLPGIILRFYKDTISEDLWCSEWKAEGGSINVTVKPLDRYTWAFHWHKYVNDCHNLRESIKQAPDAAKGLAKYVDFKHRTIKRKAFNEIWYSAKCNAFNEIWYSAIGFMLKDKRVE